MSRLVKIICFYGLLSVFITAQAKQVHIDSLRYWTAPDHTRMVFDVSSPAIHQVFLLEKPGRAPRLVIDFRDAKLSKALAQPPLNHKLFQRVRSARRNNKGLRVVVDLKVPVKPKSFSLQPSKTYGHRLVVDLFADNKKTAKTAKTAKTTKNKRIAIKTAVNRARDIVVAIDAGHGGEDSGAHGPGGTLEKKVVLKIAKKLAAQINKKPGMKAVLVRKGDYYINLRKRMKIARAANADLFVSIHADAFKNSKVKGASVFTLSKRGASSELARWLAEKENAADLVGGVVLADKEPMVKTVLMDLTQDETKRASKNVAEKVLKNFGKIGALHKNSIQKARFVVLKSPDIPSILVETAYISNPGEEKKLRSAHYQQKMATAIYKGIVAYFSQNAPADTYFALKSKKRHTISRGETLSGIAHQYGVTMRSIKSVNALASNQIRIGQVLTIPKG
jgi:N-acetylmuramoyl-L-alanine amidase